MPEDTHRPSNVEPCVSLRPFPRGDVRATTALVVAALLVIAGVFLDVFGHRRDAFWFHVLGWLTAAAALAWFATESNEWAWAAMLLLGLALLVIAAPIRRATWALP